MAVHVHCTTIQTTPTPVVQFNGDPFIGAAVGRSFLTVHYKLYLSHRLSWPYGSLSHSERPQPTLDVTWHVTQSSLVAGLVHPGKLAPKELQTLWKLIHLHSPWEPLNTSPGHTGWRISINRRPTSSTVASALQFALGQHGWRHMLQAAYISLWDASRGPSDPSIHRVSRARRATTSIHARGPLLAPSPLSCIIHDSYFPEAF